MATPRNTFMSTTVTLKLFVSPNPFIPLKVIEKVDNFGNMIE